MTQVAPTEFPYEDGDFIVIGPECFAAKDELVLSWKGQNYTLQPEAGIEADDNERTS